MLQRGAGLAPLVGRDRDLDIIETRRSPIETCRDRQRRTVPSRLSDRTTHIGGHMMSRAIGSKRQFFTAIASAALLLVATAAQVFAGWRLP
jgi:hypothetical protein